MKKPGRNQKRETTTTEQPPPSPGAGDTLHGLSLRQTLLGHGASVLKIALSPNGKILASSSADGTIGLWDSNNGQQLQTLHQPPSGVTCVTWSPDGSMLAAGGGSGDGRVHLWNPVTGTQLETFTQQGNIIYDLAWSPDGKSLAACSDLQRILLWDVRKSAARRHRQLIGHRGAVFGVAWSPDSSSLLSCGSDRSVSIWNHRESEFIGLTGHDDAVRCIRWLPDGTGWVTGSDDQTVRIWDANTRQVTNIIEGHTAPIVSLQFLDEGSLLASLGENGTLIVWQLNTGREIVRDEHFGSGGPLANLAVNTTLQLIAARGSSVREIKLWNYDLAGERIEAGRDSIHYINAKAVLLGDSGVGKSGLGIRIAKGEFLITDSTYGAQFWHFPAGPVPGLSPNIQAELTLWDLAGQPEYRLTHQLFLHDTDAALLLFDCSDPNDPFRGVPYWAKVLKKQAPSHAVKFLISARCDVSPVTVDRREINQQLANYNLDEYFKTSASSGEGVVQLFERLLSGIPWQQLPRTSTPRLFQVVREFLLECKAAGKAMISLNDLQQAANERLTENDATWRELETVVRLLQSRGLVFSVNLRPTVTWVLLKPELVNQYGASIIQAARNHPQGIGAVLERDVLTGEIPLANIDRLPRGEEGIVMEATTELLIERDLGFREMGYVVFPSQINVTRFTLRGERPRVDVAYRFSGAIETIYASLVVRLSYTDYFRREDQWKYAVEFSRDGHLLGFSMQQIEEGTGELEIYFYPGVSEFDRVTFIRFVTDHLRAKGIEIQEQIHLYCSHCSREVTNHEAIESRIQSGSLDIPCQYCATSILIPKSIEERYSRDRDLVEKQKQLARTVEERTQQEIIQFAADREQYSQAADPRIHVLHLSDIHLEDEHHARVYRTQIETDLIRELGIRSLQYLVISGDIANRATETEYQAAFEMIDSLVKRFGLDSGRVIVVPGNHDLNWDMSEAAYPFVPKRKLSSSLSEDRYIPAGEAGVLLRDEGLYRDRFAHFNAHFYRRIYSGRNFPLDYDDQTIFIIRPDDRILFLGLNSAWEIDHHFRNRAGINMRALAKALDTLQEGSYDGWLKIAVWHHPVRGKEMMNDEFMQLLAVHGFQICMHGHIHEAIDDYHQYDDHRGIRIIGAGTFGSSAAGQVPGIPLQYNLLTFDPSNGEMAVQTRKKEKRDGAWSADARWGDKNKPNARYTFSIAGYRTPAS